MTLQHDVDWAKIQYWIHEVAEDRIDVTYRQAFSELVSRLAQNHFYSMAGKIPKTDYQAYAVSSMYMVSCYACHHPLGLEDLYSLCARSYTRDKIIEILHLFVSWMSPNCLFNHDMTHFRKRIAVNEGTTCDLVTYDSTDELFVRKRIEHQGVMPSFDAMVEIVVHYLLEETSNIARLVGVNITDQHTNLYYEYVPIPLDSYFGDVDDPSIIINSLLNGVQQLHTVGIAHRDIKGMNVHVTPKHRCMILDVGSAGYGDKRNTMPICTISHRSPDLLQAEIEGVPYTYDGKCLDMWSVGVLIAEIYMGPEPFGRIPRGTSAKYMLARIHESKDSVLETLRTLCTVTQLGMLRRCMDDVPTMRPTIDEMVKEFK